LKGGWRKRKLDIALTKIQRTEGAFLIDKIETSRAKTLNSAHITTSRAEREVIRELHESSRGKNEC